MIAHSSTTAEVIDQPVVLFVDDEEGVLAGLRTSLRRLRRSYRFHFALGAVEALTILDQEAVDVVVTDMRMPGISGVDLLHTVQARFPNVIRCVLSGEAEQELVVRAVPVAHRWLSKPCDRDQLTAALTDAVRHRALLADPTLGAAVAGAASLPTPPVLYGELMELLADRDVSISDVAALVESDAAIAVKLLQWANSAFSAGQPILDVRSAVVRVGLSAVSQLVLLAEVVHAFDPSKAVPGFEAELIGHHVGLVSELSARFSPPETAVLARVGGLFSAIGLLLEASCLPDRLQAAYTMAEESELTLIQAEHRLHGVAHPVIGGHLLSIWGLPSDLVLLAAGSHEMPRTDATMPDGPLEAVRVARLLAQQFPHASKIGSPHLDPLDGELEAAVGRWGSAITDMEAIAQ